MAIPTGPMSVAVFTCAAKEEASMVPLVAVLRKTDRLLSLELVTARSGLPSPSRSPIATLKGELPVAKVTCAANDEEVITPLVAILRKTETLLLARLITTRS